ncbi:hypothetical protein B0A55_04627 [Friedmanniomyces simplex]|uniref:Uncharacterized protein n=1 Tax=Friedmanniomyces simplex TaxID=329884 RepID=A0A4U0XN26_9PEZI|nr:hypothetical protein B0A55_04627 [Friedmanniomyces simplex]
MHHQDRSEWVAAPQQYQYTVNSEPQRPHHYEAQQGAPPPLSAVQHHYPQPLVQPYTPAPAPSPVPQQQSHQPPQMPPQAEFQNMAVSSPAYHVQQQQTYQQPMQQQAYPPPQQPQSYQQPTHMQVGPMQGGLPSVAEYTASHGNMQPPPVPTSQYQPPPTEQQHYVSQTMHPPLQYRNEATGQSFTLGHYPSG